MVASCCPPLRRLAVEFTRLEGSLSGDLLCRLWTAWQGLEELSFESHEELDANAVLTAVPHGQLRRLTVATLGQAPVFMACVLRPVPAPGQRRAVAGIV